MWEWLSSINQQTSIGKDVDKGEHFGTVGGNADWCNHFESSMEIPQKIKNGSAFWFSNPTSGNISKETQNTDSKEYMNPYVHCSVIYNSQDLEAAQVPISRWVDKKAVVH